MKDIVPGYTMVPNHTLGLMNSLPRSQAKVLGFIVRRTVGWHKDWDNISLSQFEHGVGSEPGTGLSRHTIAVSVRALEALGLIRTVRFTSEEGDFAPTAYALTQAALGRETDPSSLEAIVSGVVQKLTHGGGSKPEHTIKKRLTKKNPSSITQTHASPKPHDDDFLHATETMDKPHSATSEVESTQATRLLVPSTLPGEAQKKHGAGGSNDPTEQPPPSATLQPSPRTAIRENEVKITPHASHTSTACEQRDRPSEAVSEMPACNTTPPSPDTGLLNRLIALRFSQRVATDILTQYPAEQVSQALANLPHRNARNPAAYLVSELKAGDYAPPVSKNAPPKRLVGLPKPTPEQTAEAQQADAESERLRSAVEALDEATHTALLQEARRRFAWLRKLEDDSPLLMAQLELLVKERVLDAERMDCCA